MKKIVAANNQGALVRSFWDETDNKISHQILPIIAWLVDYDKELDSCFVEPISIESKADNEDEAILLDNGSVVVPEDITYDSLEKYLEALKEEYPGTVSQEI